MSWTYDKGRMHSCSFSCLVNLRIDISIDKRFLKADSTKLKADQVRVTLAILRVPCKKTRFAKNIVTYQVITVTIVTSLQCFRCYLSNSM